MKPGSTEEESSKIHGDKLEHTEGDGKVQPPRSALDQLEIPPHETAQTDGGTKVHGDKLDPHSGKKGS